MISVDVRKGNTVRTDIKPEQIKSLLAEGNSTLWVDVQDPTEADWEQLIEQFHFHPLSVESARQRNQRSKVDKYEGYLFLSLHAWVGSVDKPNAFSDAAEEVDLFLGEQYLVTIHQRECSSIVETRLRWQLHPERFSSGPIFLLYELLDAIVDDFFPAIDEIDEEIDRLEMSVYTTKADPDVAPALTQKRRLLLLRQTISPVRDMLNQLLHTDQDFIPQELRIYFQDVYDHALRQVEQVDLHRDLLSGVLDAMMAQTSNRLNKIMKTMTGISTILMSAALITGIYGMNFQNMPELHSQYGYYGALFGMAVVAIGLTWFFKRIDWF